MTPESESILPVWRQEPRAQQYLAEFCRLYEVQDGKFHPLLHEVIRMFVNEALEPWQQAMSDAMAISANQIRRIERMPR